MSSSKACTTRRPISPTVKENGARVVASAFACSCLSAFGCGGPADELEVVGQVAQGQRCGATTDYQDVEYYDGSLGIPKSFVNKHRLAVGLIRWKSDLASRYLHPGEVAGWAWCTGTLISADLMLTAGHCFSQADAVTLKGIDIPKDNGTGTWITDNQMALEMVVEFRNQVSINAGGVRTIRETVPVIEVIENRLGGLDFAIVRLANSPGTRHGVARISDVDATVGSTAVILQHPDDLPMKVGVGPITKVISNRIEYTIDTLGGSSGAGILLKSNGKLVGINTNGECQMTLGANFGTSRQGLIQYSPTIRNLVDRSESFLVGDWDGDGRSNLAVRRGHCVLMDTDYNGVANTTHCYGNGDDEDEYLVGNWDGLGGDNIAVRRGHCVLMDTDFDGDSEKTQCFGNGNSEDEYLVGDWDGDGKDNLAVRRGLCIHMDYGFDGTAERTQCFGNGHDEDQYLVGNWDGLGGDNLAVRRSCLMHMDTNYDGVAEFSTWYGDGGTEHQYLTGDWAVKNNGRFAVRRGIRALMNYNFDGSADQYQDYGGL